MTSRKVKVSTEKKIPGSLKLTAEQFVKKLKTYRSDAERKKYHRYFKFDEDPKSKGDKFIGVRMGQVFALAKEFMEMPVKEIGKLLESPVHEVRAGACSIMGKHASDKRTSDERKKELFDLYIRRHDRINDWDLVDLASYKVVGSYLYNSGKPRKILYKLAKSKSPWERRTAILSNFYFLGKGETDDLFSIAELLINDDHPLVQKAVGWALRTTETKHRQKLEEFLKKYAATMPRITLRYALEHFDKKKRDHYLEMKKSLTICIF